MDPRKSKCGGALDGDIGSYNPILPDDTSQQLCETIIPGGYDHLPIRELTETNRGWDSELIRCMNCDLYPLAPESDFID